MEEVRVIKHECLMVNPEGKLWRGATKNIPEVRTIFTHLMGLKYEDKPNYQLIRDNLRTILINNQGVSRGLTPNQASQRVLMMSA